jgi:hypothetical protein
MFKDALHSAYLCLKIPATFSVITIFGRQKEARSIERGFVPEHKNMHFLRENAKHQHPSSKQETSPEFKKAIQPEGDFVKVALNPRVPDRTVSIGAKMSQKEQAELI